MTSYRAIFAGKARIYSKTKKRAKYWNGKYDRSPDSEQKMNGKTSTKNQCSWFRARQVRTHIL